MSHGTQESVQSSDRNQSWTPRLLVEYSITVGNR